MISIEMHVSVTLFCILVSGGFFANGLKNNVCRNYVDYYTIDNNPNCWYDLAAEFKVPDIITRNGYPLEVHKVTTGDGFILTMFRIPNHGAKNPKEYPIFVQHGIVSTSANFLGIGNQSFAFVLAQNGYDVWLGNYRGTEYSQEHTSLSVNDTKFWDHSMDEIGLDDIPSQLKYIKSVTSKKKLIYIGHSLGTTVGLMYASTYPEEAKETLKLIILMAPAATLSNMRSPYKYIAPFADLIYNEVLRNGMIRLVSQAAPARNVVRQLCLENPNLMERCLYLYNLFYGLETQTDPNIIPVYFNQLPGGTSLKVLRHSADLVLNRFARYDYGPDNFKKYGSASPPVYDVSKIKVPTHIMYAVNDWTCTKADSIKLYKSLSPKARFGLYEIRVKKFNHIDFIFGRNAKELVYEHVLKILGSV